MKNNLIYVLTFALSLLSCERAENSPESVCKSLPAYPLTFAATLEGGNVTKTSLDGTFVLWSEGDSIGVYNAANPNGETFSMISGGGEAAAQFSGEISGGSPFYGIYPKSFGNGMISGNGSDTLLIKLPPVQKYSPNSFDTSTAPMAAITQDSTAMYFRNLCGILVLKIAGEGSVSGITIRSCSQEALWGDAKVWFDSQSGDVSTKMAADVSDAFRSLTLTCDPPVMLSHAKTTFRFIIPEGCLSEGFTADIYSGSEILASKSTTKNNTILRSKIKTMPTFVAGSSGKPFTEYSEPGIYDLADYYFPMPVLAYSGSPQQYGLNSKGFRIQDWGSPYIVYFQADCSADVNSETFLSISVTGTCPEVHPEDNLNVTLIQKQDGICWLEDSINHKGYIIKYREE